MHRLLQGEVGSGKTLVVGARDAAGGRRRRAGGAAGARPRCSPPSIYRGIGAQLGALGRAGELDGDPAGTQLTLVTGSLGAAARRAALAKVADGTAGIVVGTHALLYEGVDFQDLGPGRGRRAAPVRRGAARRVAGQGRPAAARAGDDRDADPAHGRHDRLRRPGDVHPVAAAARPFADRLARGAARRSRPSSTGPGAGSREEVQAGHQAYVVCPRIGDAAGAEDEEPPSDNEPARRPPLAVTEVAPILAEGPLHGLRIGILHGKLPADEKDAVMRRFAAGDLDVLVATTVIEVGVDVPNSTVMIIMDADRFGVSQLHQLRGRVGRGSAPGHLPAGHRGGRGHPGPRTARRGGRPPRTASSSPRSTWSSAARVTCWAPRSPASTRHLRLLSLLRDAKLITDARAEATALVGDDPDLSKYPALAASVAALVDEERAEYLEKG